MKSQQYTIIGPLYKTETKKELNWFLFSGPEIHFQYQSIRKEADGCKKVCFVAVSDGVKVGFIGFGISKEFSNYLFTIDFIYTCPKHRYKGYAKKLTDAVIGYVAHYLESNLGYEGEEIEFLNSSAAKSEGGFVLLQRVHQELRKLLAKHNIALVTFDV